jgi:transposase InsO family protein
MEARSAVAALYLCVPKTYVTWADVLLSPPARCRVWVPGQVGGAVLRDRDASFTLAFDAVFRAAGVRVICSAVQAPRMNSIMERWIGSCRRELLDRTLIWNQRHLMIVLREYEDFYNTHRPHQTLRPRRCARYPTALQTWISSGSSGVTEQGA